MIFLSSYRQLLRRIWLAGRRLPQTRHPSNHVGYILIAHRVTRSSATPVRMSKIGTARNNDGAQSLIIHQRKIGTVRH
jgi:hypothetical protein